ncbi:MAG: hypothetical protein RJA36_2387 [Pseudomonadota bacterium]|jgi:two-component system response regulator PilR (NtrC family)
MSPPAIAHRLLVVDDEPDLRRLYELTLRRAGYLVESAESLAEARLRLGSATYDGVVTDMRLPDGLGTELVREVTRAHPSSRIIVITAYGSTENAVEALKAGAFDYLTKPVDLDRFRGAIAAALASRAEAPARASAAAAAAPESRQETAGATAALARIVGRSPVMVAVRQRIERVARSMAPVLILGEAGTGKELAARALHACSHRCDGPFVAVDCGAVAEHRFEAEFFGSCQDSPQGPGRDQPGFFQAASGGTLFLDAIDELPPASQARLLRAIQERRMRARGSSTEQQIDVRLISASRDKLGQAVQQGRFRHDLYYLLNVIEIRMPALRERREDLNDLASALLQRLCQDSGLPQPRLSERALAWLQRHPLPGNLRELENILHHGLAMGVRESLQPEDLYEARPWSGNAADRGSVAPRGAGGGDDAEAERLNELKRYLDETERRVLDQALRSGDSDLAQAASRLGLNPGQLQYRLQRLGLSPGPGNR